LKIDPALAAAQAGLGEIALSNGNFSSAIHSLEQALKTQPEATSLHYPLAMAYRKAGALNKARAHLQENGRVKPRIPDPLMDNLKALKQGQVSLWAKGNQAMHEGRYAEAADSYGRMVALAERDPLSRIYLGVALAQQGEFKRRHRRIPAGAAPFTGQRDCLLQPWRHLARAQIRARGR